MLTLTIIIFNNEGEIKQFLRLTTRNYLMRQERGGEGISCECVIRQSRWRRCLCTGGLRCLVFWYFTLFYRISQQYLPSVMDLQPKPYICHLQSRDYSTRKKVCMYLKWTRTENRIGWWLTWQTVRRWRTTTLTESGIDEALLPICHCLLWPMLQQL